MTITMKVICFFVLSFWVTFASTSSNTCITDPTDPSCANYVMPVDTVTSLINAMCGGMGAMSGCTINKICQQKQYKGSPYCQPFVIYKQLCVDMPKMDNCTSYVSMCSPNSTVKECNTAVIPLPPTMQCKQLVNEMCTDMPMDGCTQCANSCEWLQSYSNFCVAMPNMYECTSWKTMCAVIPSWPLCSSSSGHSPAMRMYFHTGIDEYVLFKQWVPSSNSYYIGSLVAVFLLSLCNEFLKALRFKLEKKWTVKYEEYSEIGVESTRFFKAQAPFRFSVDFTRALIHCINVGWDLLIMLIAMTYNVGLFISVCLGAFFGKFVVGRFTLFVTKSNLSVQG